MKIGIVTFWQSNDNYGQLLQCWALQEFLRGLGHEPFLIRYNFSGRKAQTSFLKKIIKIILIYPVIKSIYNRFKFKYQQTSLARKNENRCFNSFRDRFICKSKHIYNSLKELQDDPPIADCYITGSDQVWAQLLSNRENAVFFLDFGPKQILRISYAVSFAMHDYPHKYQENLISQLKKFQLITVREKTGVQICKKLGFNAFHVIDPTLLLNKAQYLQLIDNKEKIIEKDYIYIYSLNVSSAEEMRWNDIYKYSIKHDFGVKITPASGYILGNEIFGSDVLYEYATIPQWISNICNSYMVVTPSFHGIVFSIILNKKFIYVPLEGKYSQGNNRIFDLLEELDLTSFVLEKNKDISYYVNMQIDWKHVRLKLDELKKRSSSLLTQYLYYENSL